MMIKKRSSKVDSSYSIKKPHQLQIIINCKTSISNKLRRGILHTINGEKSVIDIWRDIKSIILLRDF